MHDRDGTWQCLTRQVRICSPHALFLTSTREMHVVVSYSDVTEHKSGVTLWELTDLHLTAWNQSYTELP